MMMDFVVESSFNPIRFVSQVTSQMFHLIISNMFVSDRISLISLYV